MDPARLQLAAEGVEAAPFEIPGATGGPFLVQILNNDAAKGVMATIVHLPAGGRIPAHFHAAGVVHGPHESRGGAKVLTVQSWQSRDGWFDFHLADEGQPEGPPPGGTATAVIPDPTPPNLDNRDAEQPTS